MEIMNEVDYDIGFGTEAVITQDDELVDLQLLVDLTAVMLKGEGKVVIVRDIESYKEDWKSGYTDPAPALILSAPEIERLVDVLSSMLAQMRR